MSRQKIPFGASVPIDLRHPTDQVAVPKNPLDFTNDGATCSFKVYNPAKSEVRSGAEASGQRILSVTNTEVFVVGDLVELDQDDGTVHSSVISTAGIDTVAGTITIDDVTTVDAAAGARLRVVLGDGSAQAMTEFGTPDLNADPTTWGFRGTLQKNHAGLKLDLEINVEITFVGGANLDYLETLCLVVKPLAECDCV